LLFQNWFLPWFDLPSPHCHLCPQVPGGKRHQGDLPLTLFTEYLPSKLFSLSKSEVRAGWPLTVPGQLQNELGRVMQTITEDRFATAFWQLCEHCFKYIQIGNEKLKNKHLSNSNCCIFIGILKFDFYSTSYQVKPLVIRCK
jgi:hypothetical protein